MPAVVVAQSTAGESIDGGFLVSSGCEEEPGSCRNEFTHGTVIQGFAATVAHRRSLADFGSSFRYTHLCGQRIQFITSSVCPRLIGKPGKTPTLGKTVKGVPKYLGGPWKAAASLSQSQAVHRNVF